ncbi:MAG: autoinducer synthase [Rhodobacteraceae bacterium]|nr:autoinducer synthase [Paracoccaceae bacterium]
MIRYIYGNDLHNWPTLARSMFQDRATQFHDRLGWAVSVDARGEERDAYDAINPLYVIWEDGAGRHGGSMRFLPTTGQTMVNDHFMDLADGVRIESPFIWECTRFCLAPRPEPRTAAALMLAGGEIMTGFGVKHFVGVFDGLMQRVYRRIGATPDVLGTKGEGRAKLCVGLWEFSTETRARLSHGSGISEAQSKGWFQQAFGDVPKQGVSRAA